MEGLTGALFDLQTQLDKPYEVDPPDPEGAMAELARTSKTSPTGHRGPTPQGHRRLLRGHPPQVGGGDGGADEDCRVNDAGLSGSDGGDHPDTRRSGGRDRQSRDATRDQADAVRDATDAFYDNQDAMKASIDPAFALLEAQQNLAESTAGVTQAEKDYGKNSPEHLAALATVRENWYKVEAAEKAVADGAGVTAESLRIELQKMGQFSKAEIDFIIAEFERVNAFRFSIPIPASVRAITGGGPQEHHSGGTVPGVPGSEVPIMARAGEFVSQGGRDPHGNGHGGTTNVYVSALDPQSAAKAVVQALQSYQRSNGPIPIRVR